MYGGGSGKLGRGGGAGRGSKRNTNHSPYPPPPRLHRSITPNSARIPIGGGGFASRKRRSNTRTPPAVAAAAPATTTGESFDLVTGYPLAFAMIIRLAPNLIDEIRRVEEQGGSAKIKFDYYANNSAGNVIDVGGKDFRFTWSHEPGDLCDIYEERQSGENGGGLLVESGGAWRKLNVQRVLDESTKNLVKMRSEEAERKLKSRKAIILDHGKPSVNNQMKTMATAAAEGRMVPKPRKEPPFKKRKVEPSQASGGPPKSVLKPVLSSTPTMKGRLSVSPVPSPPEQSRPSTSPFGLGNLSKGQEKSAEDFVSPQVTSKEEISKTEKEISSRGVNAAGSRGTKEPLMASPMDSRSMLITLLTENPKGLTAKALEKALGDPTVKIKPILEKIATYQTPGRYILKEGADLESFKKPVFESGSSPECVPDQAPNLGKASPDKLQHQSQLSPQADVSNLVEKIDNQHNFSDIFDDKKVSNHTEERAASSSDSGSDSDSDSDSGSDSGSQSRSKSRSPAGSGSGSSSDSDSDGSSSNKEGSDVDVDIMTSDDERKEIGNRVQNPDPGLSNSPLPREGDSQKKMNGADNDQQANQVCSGVGMSKASANDYNETDQVDIDDSTPLRDNAKSSQETMPISTNPDHQGEIQTSFTGNLINQRQNTNDGLGLEYYSNSERISNSMMSSGLKHLDEKSESARRMKAGRLVQQQPSGRNKETMFLQSPNSLSPNRPHDPSKDRTLQASDRVGGATVDTGLERGSGSSMHGRSHSDVQQSTQRHADHRAAGNLPDLMDRAKTSAQNPGRANKNFGGGPLLQDEADGSGFRSNDVYDKFPTTKDGSGFRSNNAYDNREEPFAEDVYAYGKSLSKNVKQGTVGDKTSMPFKSQIRKQGEQGGKLKDVGQMAHSHLEAFPSDGSRIEVERPLVVNGRGSLLRRELSELELGEFREPTRREDNQGTKKKLEKKNSFKLSECVSNASDHSNADSNKGRILGKMNQESKKQLSSDSGGVAFSNQEDLYKKRIIGDDIEESTRAQQVTSPSDVHHFTRVDDGDSGVGFELNRPAERSAISRKSETRKSQGMRLQVNGGTLRKASVNGPQQHGFQNEEQIVSPKITKENKSRQLDAGLLLKNKDNFWTEINNSSQNRRELFSDEENSAYFKFEKDEPELRGPIKDFSQYREFVHEYREKYDSYCSLNKTLRTCRNDFSKFKHDLQLAKDGDVEEYHKILEQVKDAYSQCGTSYMRLKKIFMVLHEELKCLKKSIIDFADSYTKD